MEYKNLNKKIEINKNVMNSNTTTKYIMRTEWFETTCDSRHHQDRWHYKQKFINNLWLQVDFDLNAFIQISRLFLTFKVAEYTLYDAWRRHLSS